MYSLNKNCILFILYGGLSLLFACGPSFPNSFLTGSDSQLLESPILSFYEEISRIEVEIDEPSVVCSSERISTNRNQVIRIDLDEMVHSLKTVVYDSNQISQTALAYETLRRNIENYENDKNNYYFNHSKGDGSIAEPNLPFSPDEIPKLVPEEFALYLEGTIYYRIGEIEKAVETWQKILDQPAEQRHYRTTWAAYMIAQTAQRGYKDSDSEKARQMYQQVRQSVREGFADSLDLAAASYGDEAWTWLVRDQYEDHCGEAIRLYLVQTLTQNTTAVTSLKQVCGMIFNRHQQIDMVALVRDRMVREVLLAYAITCPQYEKYDTFISEEDGKRKTVTSQQLLLDAIEQANLFGVENADRFAAAAYRTGDFEQAKRWLTIADMDSLISRRIRAKLYLMEGDITAAAEDLAFIARKTEPGYLMYHDDRNRLDNSRILYSELGSLYVSRKMYTQAVDALMKGGNWIDAAYIAERVLTPEELQSYVDSTWPVSMTIPVSDEDGYSPEGQKAAAIRYLLARRLTRLGQYEQARSYYPPGAPKDLLTDFDTFTDALNRGRDGSLSNRQRADAYWTAAWLMRHSGMEFMGTEMSPDWFVYGGDFSMEDPLNQRLAALERNKINIPSQEEIDRAQENISAFPDKRWHYRYFASEIAWESAALMDNEDPELARRLCLAGTWHRVKDVEYADVFYKSLVLRCGTTALGKEADRIRWFPKIPDTLVEEVPFELPELPQEEDIACP